MIRDIVSNISESYTLTPATRTADATGTAIDLRDFRAAAIILMIGIGGITFDTTNKIEFVMEHSDDNSSWSAVTASDVTIQTAGVAGSVTGSGIVRSLIAAHAAASFTEIGYVGGKRYIRLSPDFSGTHGTGTPIAALALLARAKLAPVT